LTEEVSKDFGALKALIHEKWNSYILFLAHCLPAATGHLA
jgi:hypothetical protein